MGNDGSAKAIGMGDVRLETSNGTVLILKNVKHIPDTHMNLISTGKLDDEECCNIFRDSQWKLTRGSMVVAKGKKCSSLYLMQARVIDSSINAMNDDNKSSFGMKKGYLKRRAHYLARKQTRVAFKTHRHTKKPGMLDLVYSDFHALVERQSGEKLKCIRTDNGGEYSGPFDEYCRQHGIRHQKTPPKTPQLNVLAERMNRTLVERVRCLLSQIWSDNEIFYDHLRVFGCKAFVHIPKYERSKLDAKTRPCVFIGNGQDKLGYKFYDPVQKKLVRIRDAMFMEDHTIQDFEKTNATESVPLTHLPTQVEDEAHDDQHDIGDVEIPTHVGMDDDVHEGEPESYEEAMGVENKMKWVDAMQDEMKSLHENHSFELVKLPKGKRALKNRWVYRVKQEEHTSQPLLGLAASLDLEIEQMDVKTALLYGDLDKEIYME
ncbi:hypothetical protein AAG906_004163 [Vitis piasezkii]